MIPFVLTPKNNANEILSFLTITVLTTSVGCYDDNTDTSSYTVGKKCPEHITYDGICDGNKVIFCNNNGIVEEDICTTQCMIKKAYTDPFAECYHECGDIDFRGKCTSDGYDYCHETEGLIHITCSNGETCGLKGDVYTCI